MDRFTQMIEAGLPAEIIMGAAKVPVFHNSNFVFPTAEKLKRHFEILLGRKRPRRDDKNKFIYSRFSNPNTYLLEKKLAILEKNAQAALAFPSGMSAIFTTVFSLLKPGQMILYTQPVYGCTEGLFQTICPKYGIKTQSIDMSCIKKVEKVIQKYQSAVAMLFIETPANPNLLLSDISVLSKLARKYESQKKKIWVVVDNTFMGPIFQKPFSLGADIVIYSATKFLGGHSDLVAGVVLAKNKEDIKPIKVYRDITGPTICPFNSWLITRSLETIEVRMQKQAQSAAQIAVFLANHPEVEKVIFPGLLKAGTQYEIYKKQCLGPGSMVSFYLKNGSEKKSFRFLDRLKIFKLAVSLGGTESLAEHPKSTTHLAVPPAILKASGVTDAMIRLSIGLENPKDLITDLKRALSEIRRG